MKFMRLACKNKVPVIVDPKVEDLRFYGQVSSITPNKKEAELRLNLFQKKHAKHLVLFQQN